MDEAPFLVCLVLVDVTCPALVRVGLSKWLVHGRDCIGPAGAARNRAWPEAWAAAAGCACLGLQSRAHPLSLRFPDGENDVQLRFDTW